MANKTYEKIINILKGVSNGQTRELLLELQKSREYCMEENSVLREILKEDYGCQRIHLKEMHKKRLTRKAVELKKHLLDEVAGICKPETILSWHKALIGKKYDS